MMNMNSKFKFLGQAILLVLLLLSTAITGRYGATYGEIGPSKKNGKWDQYVPAGMRYVSGGYTISGSISGENVNKPEKVGIAAFYMDAMPITNSQYQEFLDYAKANPTDSKSKNKGDEEEDGDEDDEDDVDDEEKNTKEIVVDERDNVVTYNGVVISPDRSAWRILTLKSDSSFARTLDTLANEYLYSEAYRGFPVVCVSWEAANKFCEWTTERLNEYRKSQNLPKTPPFELPTADQAKYAAAGGVAMPKYSFGGPYARNERGKVRCNIKAMRGVYGECGYLGPSPSGLFKPNDYGLYDMSGNVFWWTRTKKKVIKTKDLENEESGNGENFDLLYAAAGGSWGSFEIYAQVGEVYWRKGDPDPRIGFRRVMSRVGF
jgi:sulfatase modifying factor 1